MQKAGEPGWRRHLLHQGVCMFKAEMAGSYTAQCQPANMCSIPLRRLVGLLGSVCCDTSV